MAKPTITFFGEPLPEAFRRNAANHMVAADLVLIMGTSMQVGPFNMLPNACVRGTPIYVVDPKPVHVEDVEDYEQITGKADEVTKEIRRVAHKYWADREKEDENERAEKEADRIRRGLEQLELRVSALEEKLLPKKETASK